LDNRNHSAAAFLSKAAAEKKSVKRLANAFSIPLAGVQFVAVFAAITATVGMLLVRVALLHQGGSLSLGTVFAFLSQSNNSDLLNNCFYAALYVAYMVIPLIIICAVLRQSPFKVIPAKFTHPEFLLPAVAVGLFFSVAGDLYASYFDWLLSLVHLKTNLTQFSFPDNVPAFIVYFIELSVLAPICEETIFRGIILQNLRKYGNFFAVLVSSLMFGVLHGNLEQTPFAFIVGIICGIVVIETGSIFASMLIHCCVNTSSIIFSALAYFKNDQFANAVYFIYIAAICILTIFALLDLKKRGFFKGLKGRYFQTAVPAVKNFVAFIATPGFIVFLIFYVGIMFSYLERA
jgi:Predicted metal-dependent membrane protease